uniref:hypothetical protein n=1 Tax=uncultured Imperialibacter sp. TaxID=1672639 RepID=UPI0030DB88B4
LGYRFLNLDESVRKEILHEDKEGKVFSGIDAYHLSRGDGQTDPDRSVAILYNLAFVQNHSIRYLGNVPYLEDGEFLARVMCLAEKCSFHSFPFYQRTTRPGSATNSRSFFSKRAIEGFVLAASSLKNFQASNAVETQRVFLNQPIAKFTLLCVQSCVSVRSIGNARAVLNLLGKNNLRYLDLSECNRTYSRYGRIYNISPYFFLVFWALKALASRLKLV